jgi:hypothetical protein
MMVLNPHLELYKYKYSYFRLSPTRALGRVYYHNHNNNEECDPVFRGCLSATTTNDGSYTSAGCYETNPISRLWSRGRMLSKIPALGAGGPGFDPR